MIYESKRVRVREKTEGHDRTKSGKERAFKRRKRESGGQVRPGAQRQRRRARKNERWKERAVMTKFARWEEAGNDAMTTEEKRETYEERRKRGRRQCSKIEGGWRNRCGRR